MGVKRRLEMAINYLIVLSFLEVLGKALDFTTADGRRWQIAGIRGMTGAWERFFHEDSHPTRRSVGQAEIWAAYQAATEPLTLARHQYDAEQITRSELETRIREMFPAVK